MHEGERRLDEATLAAVFAHPDDETCRAGGTLAALAAGGMSINLVCATAGEAAPPCCLPEPVTPSQMGAIRRRELRCAARALGISQVILLGLPDGRLSQLPPDLLRTRLLRLLRRFNPATVITFDPRDEDEHPDHRAVGSAATQVAARIDADLLYLVREGHRPPGRVIEIPIAGYAHRKRQAMLCHQSQAECWRDLAAALEWGEGMVERFCLAGSRRSGRLLRLLAAQTGC